MTFDPYANQGDTAAWDPEAAAATKRAADKIFAVGPDGTAEPDETDDDDTSIKQDPRPPDQVPDPDISND
jgi:hypothetical protein